MRHGQPPNNLVLLEVKDESELIELAKRVCDHRFVIVEEPDRDDEVTALAVGPEARRLLSSLRLAFR